MGEGWFGGVVDDLAAEAAELVHPCTHESERPGWGDAGPTYVCLECGRARPHDDRPTP